MDRRTFVAAAVGVLASPSAAGQSQRKPWRIGFLGATDQGTWLEMFRGGMRDLGHVEGRDYVIEGR